MCAAAGGTHRDRPRHGGIRVPDLRHSGTLLMAPGTPATMSCLRVARSGARSANQRGTGGMALSLMPIGSLQAWRAKSPGTHGSPWIHGVVPSSRHRIAIDDAGGVDLRANAEARPGRDRKTYHNALSTRLQDVETWVSEAGGHNSVRRLPRFAGDGARG